MSCEALRAHLAPVLGEDFDTHLHAFLTCGSVEDADAFVAYLLQRGAIGQHDYLSLCAKTGVTVIDSAASAGEGVFEPTLSLERPPPAAAGAGASVFRQDSSFDHPPTSRLPDAPPPAGQAAAGALERAGGARDSEYKLLGVLAQGGLGAVHLARHGHLRRKVAYKAMRKEAAAQPELVARFLSEAQITAQLEHPNVVPIYTLEVRGDGTPAYAMKLVQGKDLARLIKETRARYDGGQPLDAEHELTTRLEHFVDVCNAIAFAHSRGVIHRDLKPANIMIGLYDELYVIDWGIARVIGQDEVPCEPASGAAPGDDAEPAVEDTALHRSADSRTRVGDVLGTPRYLSPEQAAGANDQLDGASDLYTLGLILQELITLRPAIAPGAVQAVIERARRGEREKIVHHHARERVPAELAAIVSRATRLRAEDRYASVADLRDDVRRYLRGRETVAAPDGPYRRVKRWIGVHQAPTLALMLLLVLLGSASVIFALVQREALVSRLHEEERLRTGLVEQVASRAHHIDNRLQSYQSLLHGLAAAAGEVLALPAAGDGRIYFSTDFDDARTAPPDLVESAAYAREISPERPVVSVAPNAARPPLYANILRALRLKTMLARTLLASSDPELGAADPARAREIIVGGPPIRMAAVTLAAGVHVAYPGMGGYSPTFDARQRPYYVLAHYKAGAHWGRPFTGAGGRERMLPGAMAIHTPEGDFQGVASIELSLDHVAGDLLQLEGVSGLREAMLVNRLGVAVVHAADEGGDAERSYFVPSAALDRIARGESGSVEIEGEAPTIVAFFPLRSVEWHYVTVVDRTIYLRSGGGHNARGPHLAGQTKTTAAMPRRSHERPS